MVLTHEMLDAMTQGARAAADNAYSPYSNLRVGAAVLTASGEVFSGCNVENASYGLTICAERNAVFQAVAKGHHKIVAVVVYTPTPNPTPPCGACRQVLEELGDSLEVICVCDGPEILRRPMSELLPAAYG